MLTRSNDSQRRGEGDPPPALEVAPRGDAVADRAREERRDYRERDPPRAALADPHQLDDDAAGDRARRRRGQGHRQEALRGDDDLEPAREVAEPQRRDGEELDHGEQREREVNVREAPAERDRRDERALPRGARPALGGAGVGEERASLEDAGPTARQRDERSKDLAYAKLTSRIS